MDAFQVESMALQTAAKIAALEAVLRGVLSTLTVPERREFDARLRREVVSAGSSNRPPYLQPELEQMFRDLYSKTMQDFMGPPT